MSICSELVQGTARDFPFQITNPDGTPATGIFLATDVLTASVWAGSNEVPLLTPTATWISATDAQYQVSSRTPTAARLASGSTTSRLTRPGPARRRGPRRCLPRGTSIEVMAAPGSSFPGRPTSASSICGRSPPGSTTSRCRTRTRGLTTPCRRRDWLDEMVLRNYRGGNVSLLGYHGFALDAWYTGGGRRTALTNRWLFAALQANQLLVTPRIKNVCAYYALSRICESMITKGGMYAMLAARFRLEAESLLASTTVEIDVNGDGYGEMHINMSSTNTLWA